MGELLPDATILIDFLNGHPGAIEFAGTNPRSFWLIHPVVEVEALVGARDRRQLRRMESELSRFKPAKLVVDDFAHCRAFVRRYTLAHKVGWPDCLIAASALRLGVPVVTINDKHFGVIRGLEVIRPY